MTIYTQGKQAIDFIKEYGRRVAIVLFLIAVGFLVSLAVGSTE